MFKKALCCLCSRENTKKYQRSKNFIGTIILKRQKRSCKFGEVAITTGNKTFLMELNVMKQSFEFEDIPINIFYIQAMCLCVIDDENLFISCCPTNNKLPLVQEKP